MTTPPSPKDVLRIYRDAANRIADPIERAETLKNIEFLENAPTPDELSVQANNLKSARPKPSRLVLASLRDRHDDNAAELPPHVRRPTLLLLWLGCTFFGLNFIQWFNEHTRGLFLAAAFTLFGIGLLIAFAYRFVSKSPLYQRHGNSHFCYDKNPVKYLAALIFGVCMSLLLLAVGLCGFVV